MRDNISAIVYTSNTGFTERYAKLLGQRTALPVYDLKNASALPKGTPIVYLGWLFGGKVKGLKTAVKHWSVQAVCAVGLGTDEMNRVERLAPAMGYRPGPNLFYLRGGYAPEKIKGPMKFLMGMIRKAMRDKPPVDEDGRAMMQAFSSGGDWVDAARLDGVVTYLQGVDA